MLIASRWMVAVEWTQGSRFLSLDFDIVESSSFRIVGFSALIFKELDDARTLKFGISEISDGFPLLSIIPFSRNGDGSWICY